MVSTDKPVGYTRLLLGVVKAKDIEAELGK